MANLKQIFQTTKHLLDGEVVLVHRPYLGMSELGNECNRYLWYSFRWAYTETTSKRMQRLWDRGHREEPVLLDLLKSVGVRIESEQNEYVDCAGHVKGHSDGVITGVIEAPKTRHIFESKALADKYFRQLCKDKLQKYSSVYYGQVQLYMHYEKCTRALFIAVNKNDDNLYIERIHYDKAYAKDLIFKGTCIVLDETPPPRAYPEPTFFKCKWCDAKEQCWKDKPLDRNCRTCIYSTPGEEGKWICDTPDFITIEIPPAIQKVGCGNYKAIENDPDRD